MLKLNEDKSDIPYCIECRPCVVEDAPDAHNVFLVIGNQQFCVTPYALDNLDEAQGMAGMLGSAINRLIAGWCINEADIVMSENNRRPKYLNRDQFLSFHEERLRALAAGLLRDVEKC